MCKNLFLLALPFIISWSVNLNLYSQDAGLRKKWKLIWQDNFDGNRLDTSKWTLIKTNPGSRASDWNRHMTDDQRVYSVKDGNLYLTAIKNPGIENDPRPYLTGGVDSRGKFFSCMARWKYEQKRNVPMEPGRPSG